MLFIVLIYFISYYLTIVYNLEIFIKIKGIAKYIIISKIHFLRIIRLIFLSNL